MEKFFLIGCQIDEIEIKELLLRRYHSLDFIKEMKIEEFEDFLILAIEKDKKDKVFQQYCGMISFLLMTGKKEFIDFERFYDEFTGKNIDWRPKEEILKEVEEINRKMEIS